MAYILSPEIALRSWWYVPHAYYRRGNFRAQKLSEAAFARLALADGMTALPDDALTADLLEQRLLVEARAGDALSDWQRPRFCNNRYFPRANWMITGRCNDNCLHCFNAADNARLQSEFTLEEALRLIDEMAACGIQTLTVTGGEPMLHPHFLEIVQAIYARGMEIDELNTNGHFLTPDILDSLRAIGCMPLMKISFDGIGHHDWLRNRVGAEADALRAIKLCREKGYRVMAQTNVHRRNVDVMLKTAVLLNGLGVERIRIIRTTEAPRWVENAGDACLTLDEYYTAMTALAEAYSKTDCRMQLNVWQFLDLDPLRRSYHPLPVAHRAGEYRDSLPLCRGTRGMVAIAADGEVYPCHQMSGYYRQQGERLGNVKQTGLQPLLQESPYLCAVCTTVGQLREANPTCAACPYFTACTGGCRALALALTDDKLGVDPAKCRFFAGGYLDRLEAALPGYTNTHSQ